MYPLDVSHMSQPLRIFTVISDIPLDVIPITQRSYSNNWSTVVIMSSDALKESSLFSINHSGKFQAVMEKTDVIHTEATLSFFRIKRHLVIQVTKTTINLLQLKNFRNTESEPSLPVSSLSLPPGSSIQNTAFQTALWSKRDANGTDSSYVFNKRNSSMFAVTSRNKVILIQLVENKSKTVRSNKHNEKELPCSMKEVFSHTMSSDIFSLSLSEDSAATGGEKMLVLAVSCWDSRRSLQLISLLLSNGACCILSIINCADMQLTPPLRDMYTDNEAIGDQPFKCLHVRPTLRVCGAVTQERCCVVGGCMDGHLVIFEFEYLKDSCVWKEINQWSSYVKGGIQDISLLNFVNEDQCNVESLDSATPELRLDNILHKSAFIVNGDNSDLLYNFKISEDRGSCQISSSLQISRALRQSKYRSQICSIHPLHLSRNSQHKNTDGQATDNEYVYVDNYLWIATTMEDGYTAGKTEEDYLSLCIGSKSVYHHLLSSPVTVATKCRHVAFRILNMIYLNNPTSSQGNSSRNISRRAYVLIMYSSRSPTRAPSQDTHNIRIGVQVLDCATLSTIWEYSPVVQYDIENCDLHAGVLNRVVNIALAPHAPSVPPSVQKSSETPSQHSIAFSFFIMHSYRNPAVSATGKDSVMCSLFCGEPFANSIPTCCEIWFL
jgi:hypothetical protein